MLNWFYRSMLILLIPLLVSLLVFDKVFLKGSLPIPSDILVGAYYPWLDSAYGYVVHVPVKNPLPSDIISIIYPWRFLGMSILKSGHLPLWDDTILLGVPLLANFQSALLNPFNFLFFVLPNKLAWSVQVIIQPIFIFGAMYLFLAKIKIGRWASVVGALIYAFSGYALVWLEYNTIGFGLIMVPLIFLLIQQILEKPLLKQAFWLGLMICLQIFAGYPLIAIYTLGAALIYFLYSSVFLSRTKLLAKTLLAGLGIVSGLGMAAVLLLPGLEASAQSIYKLDNTAIAASIKYLSLPSLLTFLSPDFFGNPTTGNYWGEGSYDNSAFFIASSGVVLFIMALVSKLAFRKENFIYVCLFGLSLVLATRNSLSLPLANFDLLGLNSSVNSRILFLATFSSAVLAAKAFDELLISDFRTFVKIVPLAAYTGFLIGLGIVIYKVNAISQVNSHYIAITSVREGETLKLLHQLDGEFGQWSINLKVALRNMAIPMIVTVLTTAALYIRQTKVLVVVFGLLLITSTKLAADKYLSFTDSSWFYPTNPGLISLTKNVADHRFVRERAEVLPGNTWTPYLVKSPIGQDNLTSLNVARYINVINQGKLNDSQLTRFQEISNIKSPLINTLDVQSVVLLNRKEGESIPYQAGTPFPWLVGENFKEVANVGTLRIFQNIANLGPAWFSKQVVCQNSLWFAIPILNKENYDPAETMVVDCQSSGLVGRTPGTAKLTVSKPNYQEYQLQTKDDNYVHLSKSNYPGWQAYLDGRRAMIESSNIALMGIFVPRGEHRLQLIYQPDSLKWGALTSALTLGLWGVMLVRLR